MMTQKPVKTVDDLPSISGLIAQGHKNRQAFKAGGIDYDAVTNSARYGVTNKPQTFKSFEEEINDDLAGLPIQIETRVLEDWHADLMGFGQDNAAAFARLLLK